jgi:hypothetical protein
MEPETPNVRQSTLSRRIRDVESRLEDRRIGEIVTSHRNALRERADDDVCRLHPLRQGFLPQGILKLGDPRPSDLFQRQWREGAGEGRFQLIRRRFRAFQVSQALIGLPERISLYTNRVFATTRDCCHLVLLLHCVRHVTGGAKLLKNRESRIDVWVVLYCSVGDRERDVVLEGGEFRRR